MNSETDKIIFTKSDQLQIIVDTFGYQEPHFPDITDKYKQLTANRGKNNLVNLGNLTGLYAEIHTWIVLSKFAENFSYFSLDPILDEIIKGRYRFKHRPPSEYIVTNIETNEDVTDYDAISLINGIPCVWEVKTQSPWVKKPLPMKRAMHPRDAKKKLEPVAQLYDFKPLSYVVVAPEDVANYDWKPKRKLLSENGLIASIPISQFEFHAKVKEQYETQLRTNS